MKFKSYIGKRVHVSTGKEILFGADTYETTDKDEIQALEKALEVLKVGGDGTDGSGRKIKLSDSLTLEPETSPESDNLSVTPNTSDAELVMDVIHEAENVKVYSEGSTQSVNEAKAEVKAQNHGKLNTEQSNAVEDASKPKK